MEQLFEKFGLHLNLLIAQIINFGVLFFVLYKFAYKPILNILDKRRDKIEASIRQAREIEERTRKLDDEITQKIATAKREADVLAAEGREIGEKSRNEILIRTNQEAGRILDKAKADIAAEKERLMGDIHDYIVKTSVLVVEKVLRDKLDSKTREILILDSFQELSKTS